jgi:hypothetical protein
MQLSLPQLSAHLQRGLRNLYVLHGDEPLLVQEAADALRAAARAQGFSERSVHTVQGAHFDWSAVLAAASALSLFADKQILELRIPTGKPGKEGSVALQQLVDNLQGNADILVLVMLPKLDKATRTGAWFTALEGGGVTLAVEPVERRALPDWIAQRLALQGQRVVRAGERGTREETVVPRDAPTPALPQRGREEFGEAFVFAPSPLWGEGWGEGHAWATPAFCAAAPRPLNRTPPWRAWSAKPSWRPACPSTRCNWCPPPTARPWAA